MNAISPGPVQTPILGDFIETLGPRAEEDMRVMGRAGAPEEIAPLVAFLCSDDSSWINGANIADEADPWLLRAALRGQFNTRTSTPGARVTLLLRRID